MSKKQELGGPVFFWSVISGWISCAVLYVLGWKLDERFFEGFQWSNIWNWASGFGLFAEMTSWVIIILIYAITLFIIPALINTEILYFIMKHNFDYDMKDYKYIGNYGVGYNDEIARSDFNFLHNQASEGVLIGLFTLPVHAFLRSAVGYENIFNFVVEFLFGLIVFIGKILNYLYNHYIAIILTAICILLSMILLNMKRNSNRGD